MKNYIVTIVVSDDFGNMHVRSGLIHAMSPATAVGMQIENMRSLHPDKTIIKFCEWVEIKASDLV